jgi:hypothetical protein
MKTMEKLYLSIYLVGNVPFGNVNFKFESALFVG